MNAPLARRLEGRSLDSVHVRVLLDPVRGLWDHGTKVVIQPGQKPPTLLSLFEGVGVTDDGCNVLPNGYWEQLVARIDGLTVPRDIWRLVRPKPGSFVTFAPPVRGKFGKIFGALAAVVLLAASLFLPVGWAGTLPGVLGAFGKIASTSVFKFALGVAAIAANFFMAPKEPEEPKFEKQLGFASINNEFEPGAPFKLWIGTFKDALQMTVPSFTEIVGEDQFVVAGYSALGFFSEPKFYTGDVELTTVQDREVVIWEAEAGDPPPAEVLALVSNTKVERALNISLSEWELIENDDSSNDDAVRIIEGLVVEAAPIWHSFETLDDVETLRLEYVLRNGLAHNTASGEGNINAAMIVLRHRMARRKLDGSWGDWIALPQLVIRAKRTTKAVRVQLYIHWVDAYPATPTEVTDPDVGNDWPGNGTGKDPAEVHGWGDIFNQTIENANQEDARPEEGGLWESPLLTPSGTGFAEWWWESQEKVHLYLLKSEYAYRLSRWKFEVKRSWANGWNGYNASVGGASASVTLSESPGVVGTFYDFFAPVPDGGSATAWAANTLYSTVGVLRSNGGNTYSVKVVGTSAASGGPTGTGSSIADGPNSLVWEYVAAGTSVTVWKIPGNPAFYQQGVELTTGQNGYPEFPIVPKGTRKTHVFVRVKNQEIGTVKVIWTRLIDDWNGTAWVADQPAANPAASYRDVLRGVHNAQPVPDALINMTQLQYWHERNTAKGHECNMMLPQGGSVLDALKMIGLCGYARPVYAPKHTVIIDEIKTDGPVGLISSRSASGFEFEMLLDEKPHGYDVSYVDQFSDYETKQVRVYAPGYNEDGSGGLKLATRIQSTEYPGITREPAVIDRGDRDLRWLYYRSTPITCTQALAYREHEPGDLVMVETEILGRKAGRGRIVEIEYTGGGDSFRDLPDVREAEHPRYVRKGAALVSAFTIDETPYFGVAHGSVRMEDDFRGLADVRDYPYPLGVELRERNGDVSVHQVASFNLETKRIVLSVAATLDIDFGDEVITGKYDVASTRMLAWDIVPKGRKTAQIMLLPYAEQQIFYPDMPGGVEFVTDPGVVYDGTSPVWDTP